MRKLFSGQELGEEDTLIAFVLDDLMVRERRYVCDDGNGA